LRRPLGMQSRGGKQFQRDISRWGSKKGFLLFWSGPERELKSRPKAARLQERKGGLFLLELRQLGKRAQLERKTPNLSEAKEKVGKREKGCASYGGKNH